MRRAWLGVLAGLLAAGCAPAAEDAVPSLSPAPRHVVLVVIDNLRADHVGAYGYGPPTTPRLDALAAQGVVYERAYAASSAGGESLASLWTGRLPSSGGATGRAEAAPHDSLLTLPRLFLRAGYRTGLVGNDATLAARAFRRGFDEIEVDSVPGRWTGEMVTGKALDMVDAAQGERLFLTVDYADASEPYIPRPADRERIEVPVPEGMLSLPNLRGLARELPAGITESPGFLDLVARYDAELAHVDASLGALLDGLDERGVLDDTLLIVTSSHGTEFLEHGYVGNGWTLYDEVLRVPLVVRAPRLAPGRVAAPVSLVDLLPSLREVCDLPLGGQPVDGQPLLVARGDRLSAGTPTDAVLAELVIPELVILRAAIRGDAKLIEVVKGAPPAHRADLEAGYDGLIEAMLDGSLPRPDPWGAPASRELYDLSADRGEHADVSTSMPDRLAALAAGLAEYAEHCRQVAPPAHHAARRAEPPDPAATEALQQLGYL